MITFPNNTISHEDYITILQASRSTLPMSPKQSRNICHDTKFQLSFHTFYNIILFNDKKYSLIFLMRIFTEFTAFWAFEMSHKIVHIILLFSTICTQIAASVGSH